MITTTLDGRWRLTATSPMKSSGIEQGTEWEMSIPGSLHDTLLENGLINEPYDGRELERAEWVRESTWTISRTFSISSIADMHFIKCGSLSPSSILINGKKAAEKDDDSPLLLDISGYVTEGSNTIEIVFPRCHEHGHFPGVWRSMKLLSSPDFIIAGSEAETELRNGHWMIDVIIPVISQHDAETEYEITIQNRTERGSLRITEGSGEYLISIEEKDACLWWPAGMGQQPVYPVSISVAGYKASRTIAFRTISLIDRKLFVNGRKVFMKGAVLSPLNLIPSRTDDVDINRVFRHAAEANMNTLLLTANHARHTLTEAAMRYGIVLLDSSRKSELPEPVVSSSFPSKETLSRIWNGGERNISSPDADLHSTGTGAILNSVASYFLFPRVEGSLVYLSQAGAAIEAGRAAGTARIRGDAGCMLSLLADSWPAIGPSAIEYGGKWKLLQYSAREFFSPLSPLIIDEGKSVSVYFVNDTMQREEAEFSIKLRDLSGAKKDTREYTVTADAGSLVKVAELPMHRVDRTRSFLYVKMSTKAVLRERTLLLDKPKCLKLENPLLRMETLQNGPHSFAVKLTVEKPAFCVALECGRKGIFSDKMITVRPSAEKTIFFRAEEDITLSDFTSSLKVMDLYSAMH